MKALRRNAGRKWEGTEAMTYVADMIFASLTSPAGLIVCALCALAMVVSLANIAASLDLSAATRRR